MIGPSFQGSPWHRKCLRRRSELRSSGGVFRRGRGRGQLDDEVEKYVGGRENNIKRGPECAASSETIIFHAPNPSKAIRLTQLEGLPSKIDSPPPPPPSISCQTGYPGAPLCEPAGRAIVIVRTIAPEASIASAVVLLLRGASIDRRRRRLLLPSRIRWPHYVINTNVVNVLYCSPQTPGSGLEQSSSRKFKIQLNYYNERGEGEDADEPSQAVRERLLRKIIDIQSKPKLVRPSGGLLEQDLRLDPSECSSGETPCVAIIIIIRKFSFSPLRAIISARSLAGGLGRKLLFSNAHPIAAGKLPLWRPVSLGRKSHNNGRGAHSWRWRRRSCMIIERLANPPGPYPLTASFCFNFNFNFNFNSVASLTLTRPPLSVRSAVRRPNKQPVEFYDKKASLREAGHLEAQGMDGGRGQSDSKSCSIGSKAPSFSPAQQPTGTGKARRLKLLQVVALISAASSPVGDKLIESFEGIIRVDKQTWGGLLAFLLLLLLLLHNRLQVAASGRKFITLTNLARRRRRRSRRERAQPNQVAPVECRHANRSNNDALVNNKNSRASLKLITPVGLDEPIWWRLILVFPHRRGASIGGDGGGGGGGTQLGGPIIIVCQAGSFVWLVQGRAGSGLGRSLEPPASEAQRSLEAAALSSAISVAGLAPINQFLGQESSVKIKLKLSCLPGPRRPQPTGSRSELASENVVPRSQGELAPPLPAEVAVPVQWAAGCPSPFSSGQSYRKASRWGSYKLGGPPTTTTTTTTTGRPRMSRELYYYRYYHNTSLEVVLRNALGPVYDYICIDCNHVAVNIRPRQWPSRESLVTTLVSAGVSARPRLETCKQAGGPQKEGALGPELIVGPRRAASRKKRQGGGGGIMGANRAPATFIRAISLNKPANLCHNVVAASRQRGPCGAGGHSSADTVVTERSGLLPPAQIGRRRRRRRRLEMDTAPRTTTCAHYIHYWRHHCYCYYRPQLDGCNHYHDPEGGEGGGGGGGPNCRDCFGLELITDGSGVGVGGVVEARPRPRPPSRQPQQSPQNQHQPNQQQQQCARGAPTEGAARLQGASPSAGCNGNGKRRRRHQRRPLESWLQGNHQVERRRGILPSALLLLATFGLVSAIQLACGDSSGVSLPAGQPSIMPDACGPSQASKRPPRDNARPVQQQHHHHHYQTLAGSKVTHKLSSSFERLNNSYSNNEPDDNNDNGPGNGLGNILYGYSADDRRISGRADKLAKSLQERPARPSDNIGRPVPAASLVPDNNGGNKVDIQQKEAGGKSSSELSDRTDRTLLGASKPDEIERVVGPQSGDRVGTRNDELASSQGRAKRQSSLSGGSTRRSRSPVDSESRHLRQASQLRSHSSHERPAGSELVGQDRLFSSRLIDMERRGRWRRFASAANQRHAAILLSESRRLAAAAAALAANKSKSSPEMSQHGQLCPVECLCTWKNGKQFADCSPGARANANQLTSVPAGLDPLLQIFNLSGNQLVTLRARSFVSQNLNNLQRIYLSDCHIETVELGAFENLKLVVELDFSWNKLTSVPLAQMRHLSLMRKLSMRGNPLGALTEATFNVSNSTSGPGLPSEETSQRKATLNLDRLLESYPSLRELLNLELQPEVGEESNSVLDATGEFDEPEGSEEPSGTLSLGGLFKHLQELDFGHCHLQYIKWTTLKNLNQLKRLLLDNNQLSQLSGQLVASLPGGLHELSLAENPWICDCRLLDLKRWLIATNTPMSEPARCFQQSTGPIAAKRSRRPASGEERIKLSVAEIGSQQQGRFLDQLTLDEFVCAPQATGGALNVNEMPPIGGGGSNVKAILGAPVNNLADKARLVAVYEYLEPTLIEQANKAATSGPSSNSLAHRSAPNKTSVQASEDDRITLNCSFLAYPDSSLDIIWLVEYNRDARSAAAITTTSGDSNPVILYNSRLQANNSTFDSGQGLWQEASLFGSRLLVRESRSSLIGEPAGLFKQSQIVIQTAHVDDSGRYKCVAANRAGNASFEYALKVSGIGAGSNGVVAAPVPRDQRANNVNANNRFSAEQPQRLNVNKAKPALPVSLGESSFSVGRIFRSLFSLHTVLVVACGLMASVIMAFLLICLYNYQIKPSQPSTTTTLLADSWQPQANGIKLSSSPSNNYSNYAQHKYATFQPNGLRQPTLHEGSSSSFLVATSGMAQNSVHLVDNQRVPSLTSGSLVSQQQQPASIRLPTISSMDPRKPSNIPVVMMDAQSVGTFDSVAEVFF